MITCQKNRFARKSNTTPPSGFTLLEVMVAGSLFMIFVVFWSTVFTQGMRQWEQRQETTWIANSLDAWTAPIKSATFEDSTLTDGTHSQDLLRDTEEVYRLQWHVQTSSPALKRIHFQLHRTSDGTLRHEWKTSVWQGP